MADIYTNQVGNGWCPQMRLVVSLAAGNADHDLLNWTAYYVAHGYAAYTNGNARAWSINIDGQTKSGSYNINGQTGTVTLGSGQVRVNKQHAYRNIGVSCSMTLDVTWNGAYAGTVSASGTHPIGQKTSYTVSYNANGGSGAPGNQTKWHGENLALSGTKPTRTGHNFAGWATSASGAVAYQPGSTYTGNGNLTLYAKWTPHTYTVSYNANGGTGAPGNQTKTYGVNLTLSGTRPTRTNYNFKGWGTSSSSTTASYQPGSTYTNNSGTTLYAIWELAWLEPRITNLQAMRCDSAGSLKEDGQYAKVTFNWATDRTISSIKIVCNGVTTNASGSGTSGSVSVVVGANALNAEKSYPVNVTVTDTVGGVTISTTVAPINYIMDISPSGAVAFGVPALNNSSTYLNTVEFHTPPAFKKLPPMITTYEKPSTGAGATGYIKILTLNNPSNVYSNSSFKFSFVSCGRHTCHISFYFSNQNNTNLSIGSISGYSTSEAYGNSVVYYRNPAANVLEFWIKKSEGYDRISVSDIRYDHQYMTGITYDLAQSYSGSLPSGCVAVGIRSLLGVPYNVVGGYYGMSLPNGTNSEWLRTTYNGLIPYQSGGASALGTAAWPFNNIHGKNIYANGSPVVTDATMVIGSTTNTDSNNNTWYWDYIKYTKTKRCILFGKGSCKTQFSQEYGSARFNPNENCVYPFKVTTRKSIVVSSVDSNGGLISGRPRSETENGCHFYMWDITTSVTLYTNWINIIVEGIYA